MHDIHGALTRTAVVLHALTSKMTKEDRVSLFIACEIARSGGGPKRVISNIYYCRRWRVISVSDAASSPVDRDSGLLLSWPRGGWNIIYTYIPLEHEVCNSVLKHRQSPYSTGRHVPQLKLSISQIFFGKDVPLILLL